MTSFIKEHVSARNRTAPYILQPAILLSYSGSISVPFKSVAVHTLKAYGGVTVQFHSLLISALDRGKRPPSRLCSLSSGTHWIGGWMNPRASLDSLEKRNVSCSYWKWDQDTSVVQSVAYSLYIRVLRYSSCIRYVLRDTYHLWHTTVAVYSPSSSFLSIFIVCLSFLFSLNINL